MKYVAADNQTKLYDSLANLEENDSFHSKIKQQKTIKSLCSRSEATRSQLNLFEDILECRILMQRYVYPIIDNDYDSHSEEFYDKVKNEIEKILGGLLKARGFLCSMNTIDCYNTEQDNNVDLNNKLYNFDEHIEYIPDTKYSNINDKYGTIDSEKYNHRKRMKRLDDLDKPSNLFDSNEDPIDKNYNERLNEDFLKDKNSTEEVQLHTLDNTNHNFTRNARLQYLDELLQREYNKLRIQWKEVLNSQFTKLRLKSNIMNQKSSRKFNVVDQSLWNQIQNSIRQNRVVKGIHTLRNGNTHYNEQKDSVEPSIRLFSKSNKLFDDSHLYKLFLQDFIKKSAAGQNIKSYHNQTSTQQRHLNNIKSKHTTDRKARKNRSIQYATFEKLVNYASPVSRSTPLMSEDLLFASMFRGSTNKTELNCTKRKNQKNDE